MGALSCLTVAGCAAPPSQLVLVVDSDLQIPSELSAVRVTTQYDGVVISSVTFAVASTASSTGLPLSLGIVPLRGDVSRRVRIVAEALDGLGQPVVETSAVIGFLPGRSLRLPMFLAHSCIAIDCPAMQTCTRSGCIDEAIDPEALLPGADAATAVDAGGSVDAGSSVDVGGGDAGRADTGAALSCTACGAAGSVCEQACADGASCTCGGGCPCDITCDADASCDVACDGGAACTVVARSAERADLSCTAGASCTLDARSATSVTAECGAGTSCSLGCRSAGTCAVSCTGGAHCTLDCSGSSSCRFAACDGALTVCRAGILACNTVCP